MKAVSARARWFSVCLIVLAFTVAVYRVRAQQSSAQVPAPTIRVTTHMVLVDVVVTESRASRPPDFIPKIL